MYVLAPSVRAPVKARVDSLDRRTPLQRFVDELQLGARGAVPVEVVDDGGGGGGGSSKNAREKVLVSTIHQAKGGQRRVAIVWGFAPRPRVPPLAELSNEWCVALTRAWERDAGGGGWHRRQHAPLFGPRGAEL